MGSRRLLAVASAVGLAAFVVLSGGAGAAGKTAKTTLTIESWPGGIFGYVSSSNPERCAAKRRVVVYRMQGKGRDPSRDQRVAGDRAKADDSHQWSVETEQGGRFYAVAPKAPGCAAALSATVGSQPLGGPPGAGERTEYPPCSPYISEGPSTICRLDHLHLDLDAERPGKACRFGNDSGECPGNATAGQFPWGETGQADRPIVKVIWQPAADSRMLRVFSFRRNEPNTILASLTGWVRNAGSPRFSIGEGYAQSEKGFPYGDYFYTPDLPGQAAGEPGGPLAINFQNGSGLNYGAWVDITGYLYVRR